MNLVSAVWVELDLVVHPQQRSFHHAVPEEVREEERSGNQMVLDHTGVLHGPTGRAEPVELRSANPDS